MYHKKNYNKNNNSQIKTKEIFDRIVENYKLLSITETMKSF